MTDIDYNYEYKNFLRCPNCNRQTEGKKNFKNIKSGNITKTCDKCRNSVLVSINKKPRKKKPTMKQLLVISKIIIENIDENELNEIAEKNANIKPFLKYLKN